MRCHRPGELCYTVLTRERRVAELEASGMEADWWFCGHCHGWFVFSLGPVS